MTDPSKQELLKKVENTAKWVALCLERSGRSATEQNFVGFPNNTNNTNNTWSSLAELSKAQETMQNLQKEYFERFEKLDSDYIKARFGNPNTR